MALHDQKGDADARSARTSVVTHTQALGHRGTHAARSEHSGSRLSHPGDPSRGVVQAPLDRLDDAVDRRDRQVLERSR